MKTIDREKIKELLTKNLSYEELLKLFEEDKINFLVFSVVAKSISIDKARLRRELW